MRSRRNMSRSGCLPRRRNPGGQPMLCGFADSQPILSRFACSIIGICAVIDGTSSGQRISRRGIKLRAVGRRLCIRRIGVWNDAVYLL